IVCQSFEAVSVDRGRKPVRRRHKSAERVHRHLASRNVAVRVSIRLVPLDIDDDILPAKLLQPGRHGLYVRLHLIFADRGTVGVPSVPAHGRRRGELLLLLSDSNTAHCCSQCDEGIQIATRMSHASHLSLYFDILVSVYYGVMRTIGNDRTLSRKAEGVWTSVTPLSLGFWSLLMPAVFANRFLSCTVLLLGVISAAQVTAVPAKPLEHASPASAPLTLWYRSPAKVWTDALAIGNGRLGAMLFGIPEHDRYQLNHITVWSGGPMPNADRPGAYQALPAIREALRSGDYAAATKLVSEHMTTTGVGDSEYWPSYETLGDLNFDHVLPAG